MLRMRYFSVVMNKEMTTVGGWERVFTSAGEAVFSSYFITNSVAMGRLPVTPALSPQRGEGDGLPLLRIRWSCRSGLKLNVQFLQGQCIFAFPANDLPSSWGFTL